MHSEKEWPLKSNVVLGLSAVMACLACGARWDEPAAAPPRYVVSINGEDFTVESGKPTQFQSSKTPGKKYKVARAIMAAPLLEAE